MSRDMMAVVMAVLLFLGIGQLWAGSVDRKAEAAEAAADAAWAVAEPLGKAVRVSRARTLAVSDSLEAVAALAMRVRADLVIVGPEGPLAAGVADRLAADGVPVFGPSRAAAEIESSKAFAKELMRDAGIATAAARAFDDPEEAQAVTSLAG